MKIRKKLYNEIEFEADVTNYIPNRPAPQCQNHDDPHYSDPGDDEYIEFDLYMILGKEKIPVNEKSFPEQFVKYIYAVLVDDVTEEMRDFRDRVYEYNQSA